MTKQIAEADIHNGLSYIIRSQQKDGSFAITTNNPDSVQVPLTCTLGIHALLLDVLCTIREPRLTPVINRLAAYLKTTLAASPLDSLDSYVLFYGLAVLYEYDVAVLPPDIIAGAVKSLIANEQAPGGPYRNALDSPSLEPDWLTNMAVSRFIHHVGGPFPNLAAFLDAIPTGYNRYYTTAWPLSFAGATHKPAFRHAKVRAIPQLPNGSWPIEYVQQDPHDKSSFAYGSVALSTAHMIAHFTRTPSIVTASNFAAPYKRLAAAAHADAAKLDPLIAEVLQTRLAKLIAADTSCEIGLLALRFTDALHTPHTPNTQILEKLGLANVYNWVAYTIYDDFLDDEGDPLLLSAANVALRKTVQIFSEVLPDPIFKAHVQHTFDTIDTANAWEVTHCRFTIQANTIQIGAIPDYGDLHYLHDRSLSHRLPIIGTLLVAGFSLTGREVTAIADSFRHYLIIRQLNDDLCDWQDDLYAGHISYVVAQLLHDAQIAPGRQPLNSLYSKLQRVFWAQSLPKLDSLLQQHAAIARQFLDRSMIVNPDNLIAQLIDNLADAAVKMQAEHQQANDFLHAFKAQS